MNKRTPAQRLADEQRVIEYMISLHCRGAKHTRDGARLCPRCEELARYTRERNEQCPFMETRSFCQYCKVHCYRPEMRERISGVMRYAGPRMIFHKPLLAIKHLLEARRHRH
ncbi:MAG: nitrous oxide-stimulated promoter family protein [Coriobacteriales bacterium]|nr:nitrous oxide-stimulated promoter family protein [Coriobacteriales bacterium]